MKYTKNLENIIKLEKKQTRAIILLSALGILIFFAVAFVTPFRDRVFNLLFPKPASQAFHNAFTVTNSSGSPLPQPTANTYTTDSLDVQIHLNDVNGLNEP